MGEIMADSARRHLKNAMVVTLLDGVVTEDERNYLETLRERLNIGRDEFDQLVQEVQADPKRLVVPRDDQAEETLRILVEAAASGEGISDSEEKMLKKVADHLGLGDAALARLMPSAQVDPALAAEIEKKCDEAYRHFSQWSPETRQAKFEEIGSQGQAAVIPLLRILESYRTPDGAENNLEMNEFVVRQLAALGDTRAIYYLVQQITLGDTDDEISNSSLREACAHAVSQISGQTFDGTETLGIVEAARRWWQGTEHAEYNHLAL